MKVCTKCGESKPATREYFHARKSRLRNECKDCAKKYRVSNKKRIAANGKKRYDANKEQVNIDAKIWRDANPEKVTARRKKDYELNKDKILAKNKKWSDANKEHRSAYNKVWRDGCKEERIIYQKEYYQENKETAKQNASEYRRNNPETVYLTRRKYYDNNKERIGRTNNQYRLNNKERYVIASERRRAKKKLLISTFSIKDLTDCLNFFDHKDAYTGLPMTIVSQDHVIPSTNGGAYVRQNIILCEKSINSSKNKSDMETWYKRQPFFSEERLAKIYEWIGMKNGHQQLSLI